MSVAVRTSVELGLGVFNDVACDAWFVCAVRDPLLQVRKQLVHVHISPVLELDRFVALAGEQTEHRNVILPVIRSAAEVAHAALYVDDFFQ